MLSASLLEKVLLQRFSYRSSPKNYHLNITITEFARLNGILSAKLYTNPLKFYPLCCLVQVHGCNLALLPDSYNVSNYILVEISMFLRSIHNILRSRFVVVFRLLFLEGQALCNATQNIFPSNLKTRGISEIWKRKSLWLL